MADDFYLPQALDPDTDAEAMVMTAAQAHRMASSIVQAYPEFAAPEKTPKTSAEISSEHAAEWRAAILRIDETELPMRDLIERMQLHGTDAETIAAINYALVEIRELRTAAFRDAFEHLRARQVPGRLNGYTMAQHGAFLLRDDLKRIEHAIQMGVADGLAPHEIARKVIGRASMHGIDGQTEITRQKIAKLGQRAIVG